MKKDKITIMTQIWDLYITINQGIDYFLSNPDNELLSSDIQDGLLSLANHFINDANLISLITDLSQNLNVFSTTETSREEYSTKAVVNKKALTSAISAHISKVLLAEIEKEDTLDRDVAEQIFSFASTATHDTSELYYLLFHTCNKSSLSAPMESYEQTLKLLEEQPQLLSGANALHPNYIYRPAPQHTFDRCIICGGTGVPYYRAFAYTMANFAHPHLPVKLWMKCEQCGNLYTWRYPEAQLELSSHSQMIFPEPDKFLSTVSATDTSQFSIWGDLLHHLSTHTQGNSLLEVGIGAGDLLAVALEMQYDADAVEIVPASAQKVANLLNIPVWNSDFLNYDVDKKYDIIIMGDVIEHITNPGAALDKARELLTDEGVLWLSTPNFESAYSRTHKFDDVMWKVSNHLTYFSYRNFQTLAKQHGLQIQEYHVSKRYNGSMELILKKL